LRGLTSGLRQRLGLTTHSHFGRILKKAQGQNDVSQLQNRSGQSWPRKERSSTLAVPAVRQAVLRATADAVRGRCAPPPREGLHDPQLPRGRQQRAGHSPSQ
jgi:hypothetical protein